VEGVLTSFPAVLECAVVGEREHTEQVKPKAFIRLKEGFTPSTDLVRQLLQHCGERLAAYKCPRWIDFVDELPRTANGKIQRYKLRTALFDQEIESSEA
jgi:acyl-coenzyme A synthetase/AMP-(fatty) acid ligase